MVCFCYLHRMELAIVEQCPVSFVATFSSLQVIVLSHNKAIVGKVDFKTEVFEIILTHLTLRATA